MTDRDHSRKKAVRFGDAGFTLVELMLAMSFLAILLLMISMLVLQVSTIYNKGLTLKAVNESGQLISSELQRRLSTAPRETVAPFMKTSLDGKQAGGRICVDGMVYAWNVAGANESDIPNEYTTGQDSSRAIRFIKFQGSKSDYCIVKPGKTAPDGEITKADVTELINPDVDSLVIRKFSFTPVGGDGGINIDGDTSQALYQVGFTLGTNTTDLIGSNGGCKPPAEAREEFCAVNEFRFTARATSGGVE